MRQLQQGQALKIKTVHFVTGSRDYFDEVSRTLNWERSFHVATSELGSKIQRYLPRDRKIVFVGHDLGGDLRCLRTIGLRTCGPEFLTQLDTQAIYREVSGGYLKAKLVNILKNLNIVHSRLHNGANDANFTLRALLILAINNPGNGDIQQWQANALRAVATEPLPEKAMEKYRQLERRQQKLLAVNELNFPALPPSPKQTMVSSVPSWAAVAALVARSNQSSAALKSILSQLNFPR